MKRVFVDSGGFFALLVRADAAHESAVLKMPARLAIATFGVVLVAAYAGWAAQLLAAAFGTSWAMPIAGSGYVGTWWQENVVAFIAVSFSILILLGCGLLLYGLRRG